MASNISFEKYLQSVILKLVKVSKLVDFDLKQLVFLPDIVFEIEFSIVTP